MPDIGDGRKMENPIGLRSFNGLEDLLFRSYIQIRNILPSITILFLRLIWKRCAVDFIFRGTQQIDKMTSNKARSTAYKNFQTQA
jgi:hypothetical protein